MYQTHNYNSFIFLLLTNLFVQQKLHSHVHKYLWLKKSKVVRCIDPKPLQICKKLITKLKILGFHPIDIYQNWPSCLENMTFIQYFTKFEYNEMQHPSSQHCHDQDNLENYIYMTNKLTRFTNFHPTHNNKSFFYNILLWKIAFRNETKLLSTSKFKNSYVQECHICNLLSESNTIRTFLMK